MPTQASGGFYLRLVIKKANEAPNMAIVPIHPATRRYWGSVNSPMIFRFRVISIIKAITGAANNPLITAATKRDLMGSKCTKFSPKPTSVAAPNVR